MTTIQESIDVRVPVSTAYNQWTQFESFPYFMDGVDRVVQVTDTMTHWETSIGGVHREFDAKITEQHPDERVAWQAVGGQKQGGVVTFHRIDEQTTRVNVQMEYDPDTLTEKVGAGLGVIDRKVKGDLAKFKEFIESRGRESGEWRGDVSRSPQQGE
ncbi:putative membrane protein [Kibdelosporangium banguiense]|uniref:Membrane protein n=1 Tax=Kibdelosporangium banguiense TaxID=1365924 RepID=A0ABS4TP30_9PSEU|nr:SRPBCC family protein [Kibdelosporangium banguiense]MBP2325764.1 putative membrane protein [Kibdelosporangium banguiense]